MFMLPVTSLHAMTFISAHVVSLRLIGAQYCLYTHSLSQCAPHDKMTRCIAHMCCFTTAVCEVHSAYCLPATDSPVAAARA
jgi:hypothetical protein